MRTRDIRSTRIAGAAALAAVLAMGPAGARADQSGRGITAPRAPATPAGTVTRQMWAGVRTSPALVGGALTAPSTDTPRVIADRFLASRPGVLGAVDPASLTLDREVAFKRGHVLRYVQTFQGLPVVGGTTIVRVADDGRVLWASSTARRMDPSDARLSASPVLSALEAMRIARRAVGYDDSTLPSIDLAKTAQLAYYVQPNMDRPRLVWWLELPFDVSKLMTLRGFVDAETGFVYRLDNRVVRGGLPTCQPGTQSAYVFEENPLETPDLECRSLSPYLAPGATTLANADVAAGNCVDNNACRDTSLGLALHWCDDDPTATSNAQGDFTDHVFVSDLEDEDTFSEVQIFYHVNKAFEVARSLGGFTNLAQRPLDAIANFRLPFDAVAADLGQIFAAVCFGPTYTGGQPLFRFDNAFFAPAGGLLGYPDVDAIVFGQGTTIDFSYDGDVVYHEFGHAVMNTVAPGLSFGFFDEFGFDPSPGGMHEGYADLMTLFVTDDPEIGEYAGGGLIGGPIRNTENASLCPDGLTGETHEDALPITGAIFEARTAIAQTPGDKVLFDEAVFAAQQAFVEFDNFESAATKTVMEIEAALGPAAAATADQIFQQRGLYGCNNRVVDGALAKPLMFVGGNGQMQGPAQFPGPIQWRFDLPGGATSIAIAIERSQLLAVTPDGSVPTLKLVLKEGAEIRWSMNGGELAGDFTDSVVIPLDTTTGAGSAAISRQLGPGVYFAQLVLEGTGPLALLNTTLQADGDAVPPDAGPGGDAGTDDPDAGPGGGNNPGDGDETGGCGCAAGADPSGTAGALALCLLGLALVTRRRRTR